MIWVREGETSYDSDPALFQLCYQISKAFVAFRISLKLLLMAPDWRWCYLSF